MKTMHLTQSVLEKIIPAKLKPNNLSGILGPLFRALVFTAYGSVSGAQNLSDMHIRSRSDLEYAAILFEYHQQDYFNALIEHEYAAASGNGEALSDQGRLLKGGMALSYGMADVAQTIFHKLLARETEDALRNRAWYYLAKLYHLRSRAEDAHSALQNIEGELPPDLHLDYHYLATLVNKDSSNLARVQKAMAEMPTAAPQYPYLLFNLGVSYLSNGNQAAAVAKLTRVIDYGDGSEEMKVLADRARHGLAQMAMQDRRFTNAWNHLRDIRTEGLYSNRGLLAYAWTAIRQELYQIALPALQLLNQRSIALPEVQECKVLLGYLHEQQGSTARALKSHLEAESEFLKGLEQLEAARRVLEGRNLPRDFIANLEAAVDDSDWFGVQPSIDYDELTPFLVDLMASNSFNQVLRELVELYAIHDNLNYWQQQTAQHQTILDNAAGRVFDQKTRKSLEDHRQLHERLRNHRSEVSLMTLSLESEERDRFSALLENSDRELARLGDKLQTLRRRGEAYRRPAEHPRMVAANHQRITESRAETETHIARLEPLMRKLVTAELNRHEERMRYYLAQTRLAKARLYDAALIELNAASDPDGSAGGSP